MGFVLSPVDRLSVTLDYIHYAIRDEVAESDGTKLLETEAACRLGQLEITSPTYISQLIPEGYSQAGAGTVGSWTLLDLSIRYEPIKSLSVTLAVNNVGNTMPPADHSQPGNANYQPYNQFNYNVYGREYYLGATYKPGK